MRIYVAAPLFNEGELERNRQLRDFVRSLGHDTYLPQEDGGIAFDQIVAGADMLATRKKVFDGDIAELKKCDAILAVLDGRVPDEGVCIELGYAFALGKMCVGYLTDKRTLDKFGHNLMIEGCLTKIAHSVDELKVALSAAV